MSYSGVARVFTKAKEIKDRAPDTTIFLNAGTAWQGRMNGLSMVPVGPSCSNQGVGVHRDPLESQGGGGWKLGPTGVAYRPENP